MIAIGGAIGVGLFLGSAQAIQLAGPALLLAYVIGGMIMFFFDEGVGRTGAVSTRRGIVQHLCQ